METAGWNTPHHARHLLSNEIAGATYLRIALGSIPPTQRDHWWDQVFFGENFDSEVVPDDSADLPQGCAPYLPCPLDTVLAALESLQLKADDILVEVGSGIGRTAALSHLLSGAPTIGIEIQKHLAEKASLLAAQLKRPRLILLRGDAADLVRYLPLSTAYFLYCPFGGRRLSQLLSELEQLARIRKIRVCCVDMAPLNLPWLELVSEPHHSVRTYQSAFRNER